MSESVLREALSEVSGFSKRLREEEEEEESPSALTAIRAHAAANDFREASAAMLRAIGEVQSAISSTLSAKNLPMCGDGLWTYFEQERAATETLRQWISEKIEELRPETLLSERRQDARALETVRRSFVSCETDRINALVRLAGAAEAEDGGEEEDTEIAAETQRLRDVEIPALLEELSKLECVPSLLAGVEEEIALLAREASVLHSGVSFLAAQLGRCVFLACLLESEANCASQLVAVLAVAVKELDAVRERQEAWFSRVSRIMDEQRTERPGEPLPDADLVLRVKSILESALGEGISAGALEKAASRIAQEQKRLEEEDAAQKEQFDALYSDLALCVERLHGLLFQFSETPDTLSLAPPELVHSLASLEERLSSLDDTIAGLERFHSSRKAMLPPPASGSDSGTQQQRQLATERSLWILALTAPEKLLASVQQQL